MSKSNTDNRVEPRRKSTGNPTPIQNMNQNNVAMRNLNSLPSGGDSQRQSNQLQHDFHDVEYSCDKCNCGRLICPTCKEPLCEATIVACGCTPCLGCYHEILEKKVILNNVKKTDSKILERVQDLSDGALEQMAKFIHFFLSILATIKMLYFKGRFVIFFALVSFALGVALSYKHIIDHFFLYMAHAFREYKYNPGQTKESGGNNEDLVASFFSYFLSDASPNCS